MKFGLTAYGTVFAMGIHSLASRERITALKLLEMAQSYGLQGGEIPYDMVLDADLDELSDYAREHTLFINIAAGGFDPMDLKEALRIGQQVGAMAIRTVVGGAKFGGDRRHIAGSWQSYLQSILHSFHEVMRSANPNGPYLTVENHQDLTSEELIWLCESIGNERFGITLDTGNPLATAEEPVDFFRRLAPFEKGALPDDIAEYEMEELHQGLAYLALLTKKSMNGVM